MQQPRLNADVKSSAYSEQTAYSELHKLFMQSKLSHYKTKTLASHKALGLAYDEIDRLIDSISEKLIGYSDVDPEKFELGNIIMMQPREFGIAVIGAAERLETMANTKKYPAIANLAQELSGVGAQLKYLARFP